jgi:hypothetical protein
LATAGGRPGPPRFLWVILWHTATKASRDVVEPAVLPAILRPCVANGVVSGGEREPSGASGAMLGS